MFVNGQRGSNTHVKFVLKLPSEVKGRLGVTIVLAGSMHRAWKWCCLNCGMPNLSSSFFNSKSSLNFSNKFANLQEDDESSSEESSILSLSSFRPAPNATSSPIRTRRHNTRQDVGKLGVMTVNCNSLQSLNKRSDLLALIDLHQPDIILGQESKLGPEHLSSEVFPNGYKVIRKDRRSGGGGCS